MKSDIVEPTGFDKGNNLNVHVWVCTVYFIAWSRWAGNLVQFWQQYILETLKLGTFANSEGPMKYSI